MLLTDANSLFSFAIQNGGHLAKLNTELIDDLMDFAYKALPKIVVTIIAAWIFVRMLKAFTRHIVRITERHAASASRIGQVKTLASVMHASGIGFIVFVAALEVLPLFGFKLEPLLASAGIAGVAIGLAAQTIVKDCLNGILILVEDQYNVGDKVRVAGVTGIVESLSLRKTMVRDGDGTLYFIPNSQITTVANLTRDYSVATINVSVDFSADPDKVMKLLMEVAMSVRNDPEYRDVFLADPTLLGVDTIKGSQVIYPVQLKTKADKHWGAMRETQRRIRIALEKNGLLPGDPLRVYGSGVAGQLQHRPEAAVAVADPTTAKANEVNPFTGEGM
ncbi:mechanosensitive ion channel family protein [Pseudacidobacterium ailaaui]|jgi:small conductance mechanosensitive channel|uniref:mechanosensitive ion channel family protein n=1 Tax=Pseudacidobacterium ailaaui TaxID=1382359 RepID=UPI000679025C|nr:mechanosensitive ion channel family protein [Pseudacidobacterium ailaaui]